MAYLFFALQRKVVKKINLVYLVSPQFPSGTAAIFIILIIFFWSQSASRDRGQAK
jgi:hypothetical protein